MSIHPDPPSPISIFIHNLDPPLRVDVLCTQHPMGLRGSLILFAVLNVLHDNVKNQLTVVHCDFYIGSSNLLL